MITEQEKNMRIMRDELTPKDQIISLQITEETKRVIYMSLFFTILIMLLNYLI